MEIPPQQSSSSSTPEAGRPGGSYRPGTAPQWSWPPEPEPGETGRQPAWNWPAAQPPPTRGRGLAVADGGSPYHRLARTERHRWWRPPVAVALVAAVWLLAQILVFLVAVLVAPPDALDLTANSLFAEPLVDLTMTLLLLAAFIPLALLAARFVQRRPAGSVSSVVGRLRWRWLLICLAVAVPGVLVGIGVTVVLVGVTEPTPAAVEGYASSAELWLSLLLILLLVPFQAAGEEYGVRGFLYQAVGSYGRATGPWPAIVVTTVVFTALHSTYDILALTDVAIFGLVMGWLVWRTGGLEAAIALHTVHNLVAFGLAAWQGALDDPPTEGSWQGLVGTLVEVTVFLTVVVWLARRRSIARVSPPRPHQEHPPQAGQPT